MYCSIQQLKLLSKPLKYEFSLLPDRENKAKNVSQNSFHILAPNYFDHYHKNFKTACTQLLIAMHTDKLKLIFITIG